MKQEDIIRMAQEAGGTIYEVDWCFEIENLQRFAALVEQRVALECAELCDDLHDEYEGEDILAIWCAEGIRAYYKLQEPQ